MRDITTIRNNELKKDLNESRVDIMVCESALRNGVTQYSEGSVQKRLDQNKYFVKVITAEIERREKQEEKFCKYCERDEKADHNGCIIFAMEANSEKKKR